MNVGLERGRGRGEKIDGGRVDVEAKWDAKTSAFSEGSEAAWPEEDNMGGKVEGQKLRETALARDQNERLPEGHEASLFARRLTNCSLAFSMVAEHLLRAVTYTDLDWGVWERRQRRKAAFFFRTAREHAWKNHSGE